MEKAFSLVLLLVCCSGCGVNQALLHLPGNARGHRCLRQAGGNTAKVETVAAIGGPPVSLPIRCADKLVGVTEMDKENVPPCLLRCECGTFCHPSLCG